MSNMCVCVRVCACVCVYICFSEVLFLERTAVLKCFVKAGPGLQEKAGLGIPRGLRPQSVSRSG